MSIFDPLPTQSAAVQAANTLLTTARNTHLQAAANLKACQDALWNNPRAKPDEVIAALGKDAAEVLAMHDTIGTFVNGLKAGSNKFTPPQARIANVDGTVTLATTSAPAPKSVTPAAKS